MTARDTTKQMFRAGLLAALLACVSAASHAQQLGQDERNPGSQQAVLTLWNRPIVTFRATVSGIPPEQRVRNARERIDAHVAGSAAPPPVATQSVQINEATGVVVTIGGNIAFGLVPADLDAETVETIEQAASRAGDRLREAFIVRQEQRRPAALARSLGLALLTLAVFVAVVRLILWTRDRVIEWTGRLLKGRELAIAGIDIVPTLTIVERATVRVVTWALIGLSLYLATTILLQLFPYTAPWGERLGNSVANTLAAAGKTLMLSVPNLLAVAVVLLITRAAALWASRLLAEVEQGVRRISWLEQEQARATRRISTGLIWAVGIVTAYPMLPWSGSVVFQGMSLVLGLAVSLGSTGLINHWISGLVILYSRSFRVGDYVIVGGAEGVVTEMGALATKLRTMRREEVTIPNAVMTTDKLTNFTRLAGEQGALLSVSVCIGYSVPWESVRTLLLQAAARTPRVRAEPAPRVLQWELSDFFVQYLLHVYLERPEDRIVVRSDLNATILNTFSAAGVQIMTPHFESQPERPVIATAARGSAYGGDLTEISPVSRSSGGASPSATGVA